jgi:uncharacterized protein YdeI (YjbR/CyaY-like superfamily)
LEEKEHLYFKNHHEWRSWLHENHHSSKGVYLIFYKVTSDNASMRWEEAVKVAICYGWIDSTVKNSMMSEDDNCLHLEKIKSVWSKVNKTYIDELIRENLMHESGLKKIETAKQNGSWESLDAVENLEIPADLQKAFCSQQTSIGKLQQL